MSKEIDRCIRDNDGVGAVQLALDANLPYLAMFLGQIMGVSNISKSDKITVQLLTNWCSTSELTKFWNRMSKGNGIWNKICLVEENPDYYVIINSPPKDAIFDKKKTVVFRMEPHMSQNKTWGEWSDPDDSEFLKVFRHEKGDYNNVEWHLDKTWSELSTEPIVKTKNILSVVLSEKYRDIGHMKRVDFVKFLEKKGLEVHVYGSNKWDYKNYQKSLPIYCKDEGLIPYKYTFNAENNSINNYWTEKLTDGILAETLVFYWGCPNIREYIDPRAYVQLELSNFEHDYETVKRAIEEDWHSQRLPYIKEAKNKLLNELQFFPRLEKILI